MTYHPDSFKQGTPASYYCSECKYRHNKGSIRYHDHWMWRTDTPEVLRKRQLSQQGFGLPDFFVIIAVILVIGVVAAYLYKFPDEAPGKPHTMRSTTPSLFVWHDDAREVTCYLMYNGNGISCVPDTKKMLWIAQNPTGLPPQTKKEN